MLFKQFKDRVRDTSAPGKIQGKEPARLVPIWRDILLDTDTPVSAFAKLRRDPFAFLLESAPAGSDTWARYTFMGTEPRRAWRLNDGVIHDWTASEGWHNPRTLDDPLADLESLLDNEVPAAVPELEEFWGGLVGFFGYDIVRLIEGLPNPPKKSLNVPEALFVLTRSLVIIDNLKAEARVVISVSVPAGASDEEIRRLYDEAAAELEEIVHRLQQPSALAPLTLGKNAPPATGKSSISKEDFLAGVDRIKQYVKDGDCFQGLIARRIDVPLDFSTSTLYRALRVLNPSPYMFHLLLDGVELVGSSPELLVRLTDNRVTVRPIAGTRKRGANEAEDEFLSADLLADEKERAEHLMLVDLGRNDVGRISDYGSVEVTDFMQVERYSHVLHIVSQVEGEVKDGVSALEVFKSTFPAGTMTGAPKVRSMEIIDELEPERRGPYAGALGYIASGGKRMDLAITIRTCTIADGIASVQAGAGIVADSDPEMEWEETENKARAMLSAIGQARASTTGG